MLLKSDGKEAQYTPVCLRPAGCPENDSAVAATIKGIFSYRSANAVMSVNVL